MNSPEIKELVYAWLSSHLKGSVSAPLFEPVGGGSINSCYKVTINGPQKFFLKLNSSRDFPGLFEKEANGLSYLAKQECLRIPNVIHHETNGDHQWLLLEWVERGTQNEDFWRTFGEQLARLHTVSSENYGFHEDNYMGSLPQDNGHESTWTRFFIDHRLRPQVEMAINRKLLEKREAAQFDQLYKKLDEIFEVERPSLLHGDLWSGNFMCDQRSSPVLVDPAVYYGHRSIDLAMTTLFGGFEKTFYDAYHYHYQLPGNYALQWEVCNLYPLLIHLNLFGSSYLPSITHTLHKL
ncbi:MAG: fructosamine kinase family protein [Chitinophagaceae bacterium]|nr:fructosamine kinase family protein [Chitinophagaceae bacterium]